MRHVRSLCKDANGIKQIDYIEYLFVTPMKTLPVLIYGLTDSFSGYNIEINDLL